MTEPMTMELARKIAAQESPLPSLAGPALRFFRDRFDAMEVIAVSVARALERHGFTDVDDPGEAIDALASPLSGYQTWVEKNWNRRKTPADGNPLRDLYIMGLGIGGEAGEVQELLKKHVRDGREIQADLLLELGDVLHYLTRIASNFGLTLSDVMDANRRKLEERHAKREAKERAQSQRPDYPNCPSLTCSCPQWPKSLLGVDVAPDTGEVTAAVGSVDAKGNITVTDLLTGEEAARKAFELSFGMHRQDDEWPQVGDLVRYGEGSTALAVLKSPHVGGFHARQCMGGITFVHDNGWSNRFYRPSSEDLTTWLECAKWRGEVPHG